MAIPVALCADDFGLSAGVDEAILTLIRAGRLTATSVMVAGPHVAAGAPDLAALADRADIGLHLTFTDLPPLAPQGKRETPRALGPLIRTAFLGGLDPAAVRGEVAAQIARFAELFGRPPDFIDGHQHVHVLPTIRKAVLDQFAEGRLDPARTWMRLPAMGLADLARLQGGRSKAAVVAVLSLGLAARARRAGLRTNSGFFGFTDFRADGSFGTVFGDQFARAQAGALFMCHPATRAETPTDDPIAGARVTEYAYLGSERFAEDLARHGVRLARLADIAS